jgi:threonine dehydrogenase-like Zn-dependent dehydrogenase
MADRGAGVVDGGPRPGDPGSAGRVGPGRIRNITITTGLVYTSSTPKLLDMLVAGRLDLGHMVTHRFALDRFAEAYDVFADPIRSGALKVVLSR